MVRPYLLIAKALSDETRARALMCLGGGELCLCQLIEVLGLSPSTVSKHMSILRQAGLVERRKDGRWHYYRLLGTEDGAPRVVGEALRWAKESLKDERLVSDDAERLRRVREEDRADLARCYGGKCDSSRKEG